MGTRCFGLLRSCYWFVSSWDYPFLRPMKPQIDPGGAILICLFSLRAHCDPVEGYATSPEGERSWDQRQRDCLRGVLRFFFSLVISISPPHSFPAYWYFLGGLRKTAPLDRPPTAPQGRVCSPPPRWLVPCFFLFPHNCRIPTILKIFFVVLRAHYVLIPPPSYHQQIAFFSHPPVCFRRFFPLSCCRYCS